MEVEGRMRWKKNSRNSVDMCAPERCFPLRVPFFYSGIFYPVPFLMGLNGVDEILYVTLGIQAVGMKFFNGMRHEAVKVGHDFGFVRHVI